ncbi:TPA: hypothetical protein ACX6QF_002642 [Photobacterium damselae]|uniref:Uncharacterized protein n=5 Tax=Photobacterium damselae TaxID=38293 RepID=D0YY95_PHODD|nr:hypothetical protein [Photobacterium damselae]ARR49106.1 hypothetical protein CAY62_05675 [Photobacterium damselae subsp. damselae]AWK82070.1 hypothetical protein BST98_08375 [Photobacterium damselae]EEZ41226.1 hypothetical protein VDA_002258 [Photobacterium damselae subsp. damselae CIP 102761]EHA1079241.1 hypothetical protein [Photobacterium damselae]EJN6960507.1 hypothetical protein [Photobacterium damselae]
MENQDEIMTGDMLVETVENQLADSNPIVVKETLMRLMMTGTSREDAIEMMACALSIEVFDVMKNEGKFDLKRYSENLSALPDMPWTDDE